MTTQDTSIKVVLLGESAVGKTSIVNIINTGQFVPDVSHTVGACFQIKKVIQEGVVIRLNIWDTAGQERFRSLAPMFYRDADFVVLVYAVNSQTSFDAINQWYENLKYDCPVLPKVFLVANKIDLEGERVIPASLGQQKAAEYGSFFYEVSAKTGKNEIIELFDDIAKEALKLSQTHSTPLKGKVENGTSNSESGCLC